MLDRTTITHGIRVQGLARPGRYFWAEHVQFVDGLALRETHVCELAAGDPLLFRFSGSSSDRQMRRKWGARLAGYGSSSRLEEKVAAATKATRSERS